MSENSKKTICPSCGAEVPANESKGLKQVCHILRGVLEDEETDVGVEVLPVADEPSDDTLQDVSVAPAKPSVKDRIRTVLSQGLIIRACVFLLSIALLAMSFAPMIHCNIETENGDTYTVSFSGMDSVKAVAVFSYLLSEEAVFGDDESDFQGNYAEEDFLKQMVLTHAMTNRTDVTPMLMIGAVMYLLYAVLCVSLVIVSGKNLVTEFFAVKKHRSRQRKYASDALVCLLLCLLPAVVFCLSRAFRFYTAGFAVGSTVMSIGTGMAFGSVLSLVILIPGSVFLCASRSFASLPLNRRYFDRRRVKHMLCALLVLLALLFSLFPCVEIFVWDEFGYDVETVGVSTWDFQYMTSEEWMTYHYMEEPLDYVYVESAMQEEGAGKALADTFLIVSPLKGSKMLYLVVELVLALTLFFGGLLFWRLLRGAFFGVQRTKSLSFFKAMTLIGVSVNLVLAIILQYLMALYLPDDLVYYIEFGLGAGVVLAFASILLAVVLRLKKKKPVVYVDEDYDNADVSYAPYVLHAK